MTLEPRQPRPWGRARSLPSSLATFWGAVLLVAWVGVGCTDAVPTLDDGDSIPVGARTVEVIVPFSEFVESLDVFAGFGSRSDAPALHVALDYEGDFQARSLVRFGVLPRTIQVFPPGETQSVGDSAYVPVGGRLVVTMDTTRFAPDEPVELEAGAVLSEWDVVTAGWEAAVDTLGGVRLWDEPGGGPVRGLGRAAWNPQEADTVVFAVDSVTATAWATELNPALRAARVSSATPGALMEMRTARFVADVRSSVNPDTVVSISAGATGSTFIYSPEPGVSPTEIRIGGAPARRAFLRFDLPTRLETDSDACQGLGELCPLDITPERVIYAGLVLTGKGSEPAAFTPRDTLRLDARPALAEARVPRSPLGSAIPAQPRPLLPDVFRDGRRLELPITAYVESLLAQQLGTREEEAGEVPRTVALLSPFEPTGFTFASFVGPGQEGEPFLRLILTISEGELLP
ncbi:MAG: hypothetical protein EA422_03090 [Gemmatimonadales bacterium]|nr:MAG: hypothetical protein EA422_03090 [Gemmatimonadales bacterium]